MDQSQTSLYVCPVCHGSLQALAERYQCAYCRRIFPIVLGIPDFRIFPDPYISMEEDWEKGRLLKENRQAQDFQSMVAAYYAMTPEVPRHLAERYQRYVMAGVERGRTALEALASDSRGKADGAPSALLEIGCGTGGLLMTATERYAHVVGIDIAFRWLVVAQKRLAEVGKTVPLLCCSAEYLPFPPDQFDHIVAGDVIEHSREPLRLLQESRRVLKTGGTLFLITQNRFTLLPEPCVRVWGVGFLPRRWMNTYVKWVRGIPYDNVRLLSGCELKRVMRETGFQAIRLALPIIGAGERARFRRWEPLQIKGYEAIKRIPLLRRLLYWVGPTLWAFGCKERLDQR